MKLAHVRLVSLNDMGTGIVVAFPASVAEYLASVTDRDGARDGRARLWRVRSETQLGDRVELK